MTERIRPKAPKTFNIALWTVLLLLYVPILVMIISSLLDKNSEGFYFLSTTWYQKLIQDEGLVQAFERSLIVASLSSLISTLIGFCVTVSLEKTLSLSRKLAKYFNYVSLLLPEIVFALSLLSWFALLGFDLGLKTVILAHVTFSIAYVVMTMASRLQSFDDNLTDAARDLGAGDWLILFKIILPQMVPALISSFLLCFVLSFDDFLISFYTTGVGSDTLPIRLYTQMRMGLTPKLSAMATLMLLFSGIPMLLYYLLGADTPARVGKNKEFTDT